MQELINECALIVSAIVSLVAVVIAGISYRKVQSFHMYQDLDRLYFDLLALAITNPKFVDRERTQRYKTAFSGEERLQYEAYAFIAWNICESIFDRKCDKELFCTWGPVIRTEADLHMAWFDAPENYSKFKTAFRVYVKENYSDGPKEKSRGLDQKRER